MTRVAGEISDCTITGPLDVNLNKKDSWLDFSHVTFEDHADFSGTRALGIRFDRCRFLKGVNLSGVRLTSSLIAYKTAFLTDAKAPGPALRFDGAQIGEELTVLACSVEGGVFGENLRVTGNADFRGLRVYAKGAAPRGALLQNLADRNEFREAFGGGYPRLPCAFRLMGSQVGGSLLMAALYDESIKDLPDPPVPHRFPRIAFLGGNAMLANVKISGDLDLRGLVATGRLSLQNSTIGGASRRTLDHIRLEGACGSLPVTPSICMASKSAATLSCRPRIWRVAPMCASAGSPGTCSPSRSREKTVRRLRWAGATTTTCR